MTVEAKWTTLSQQVAGVGTAQAWVTLVSGIVTAVAILVGAAWAYFKFVKGRTFRPRLQVELSGEWLDVAGQEALHVRLTVSNIGASKLRLLQRGSGLRLSANDTANTTAPASARWQNIGTFSTLTKHEWIEPAEHVVEDDLFIIDCPGNLVLAETRLVLERMRPFKNTVVMGRTIFTQGSSLSEKPKSAD